MDSPLFKIVNVFTLIINCFNLMFNTVIVDEKSWKKIY